MELYIETLTGTAFELRVSPFETIMSVKAKIQRLEGIPVSQQHLIWQSKELDDDYCLHDYSIHDGATLKLVLALRGGPINTRRIPMEDSTLREMAEYMEANQDDILEKLPGNRQVTLLVFREGDQLNFFRVVDRGDGTLSPLTESISGASVYNLLDDQDEVEGGTATVQREKVEENIKTREKMSEIRTKLENLTVTKKPPVSSTAQYTLSGLAGRSILQRHVPAPPKLNQPANFASRSLNRNLCLPPVGVSPTAPPVSNTPPEADEDATLDDDVIRLDDPEVNFNEAEDDDDSGASAHRASNAVPSYYVTPSKAQSAMFEATDGARLRREKFTPNVDIGHYDDKDSLSVHIPPSVKSKYSYGHVSKDPRATYEHVNKDPRSTYEHMSKDSRGATATTLSGANHTSTIRSYKDIVLDSLKGSIRASSRYAPERKKDLMLESLSSEEARAMSGLLRQASIERLGASRIGGYAAGGSGSRTKLGGYPITSATNLTEANGAGASSHQPDHRLVSGRLNKLTSVSTRDGSRPTLASPSHRLPPVKPANTSSKQKKPSGAGGHKPRCYYCAKKTGLANSYMCRCGKNYCTLHRYAEAHECTFDYKTEGRKILEQTNPVVSAPKLPKI